MNSSVVDPGVKPNGIVDERGIYFKDRSLVLTTRQRLRDPAWPTDTGARPTLRVVQVCGLLGQSGLDLGPYVHVLDECALADPLLARLPAVFNEAWRVGHYRRMRGRPRNGARCTTRNVSRSNAQNSYSTMSRKRP